MFSASAETVSESDRAEFDAFLLIGLLRPLLLIATFSPPFSAYLTTILRFALSHSQHNRKIKIFQSINAFHLFFAIFLLIIGISSLATMYNAINSFQLVYVFIANLSPHSNTHTKRTLPPHFFFGFFIFASSIYLGRGLQFIVKAGKLFTRYWVGSKVLRPRGLSQSISLREVLIEYSYPLIPRPF